MINVINSLNKAALTEKSRKKPKPINLYKRMSWCWFIGSVMHGQGQREKIYPKQEYLFTFYKRISGFVNSFPYRMEN